jgi:ABC-type antimicrobial peptide transport system permease subunit
VVVVRTIIERKAELALLASIGFDSAARARLILSENIFLLAAGVVVGTGCAVIGIIPTVIHSSQHINAGSLALTLFAVFGVGVVSSALAVALAGRNVTPADLRHE